MNNDVEKQRREAPNDLAVRVEEESVNVPSIRILGIAAGAILAVPIVLVVVLPLVVTFLTWIVGVPGTILGTIVPGSDDRSTKRYRV